MAQLQKLSVPRTDKGDVELGLGGQARGVRKATESRNPGEDRVCLEGGQLLLPMALLNW